MKAIPKQDIETYKNSLDKFLKIEKIINSRIDYIISKICSTYNIRLACWSHNQNSGKRFLPSGHLTVKNSEIQIDAFVDFTIEKKFPQALWKYEDGRIIDLTKTIPVSWMYKDFQSELEKGMERYFSGPIEKPEILHLDRIRNKDICLLMEDQISKRIEYILNTIASIYSLQISAWRYKPFLENACNYVDPNKEEIEICVRLVGAGKLDTNLLYSDNIDGDNVMPVWVDGNGETWRLLERFPSRWLYEDFENELTK